MSDDPRLRFPDDLDQLASELPPAGRGMAAMRRLIGLLPNPLGSRFPRGEEQEQGGQAPEDPQAGVGIGAQTGLGTGAGASPFNPGTVPGSAIIPGSISGGAIQAGAITAASIAADSITANHIQANAVTTSELAANSVSTAKMQAGSITANEIATGTITGVKLADGTVSDVKIASGLSAAKITTGTLTAITITGCTINAGGSGVNGFNVLNGAGANVGVWNSNGISTPGIVIATQAIESDAGIVTAVVSGIAAAQVTTDGTLLIDNASSPARLYFRYSGAWHYVAQDAGFTIPRHETLCPACGEPLLPGENLLGVADRWQHDGALHGLWKHERCRDRELLPSISDAYAAAASDETIAEGLFQQADTARRALGVVVEIRVLKPESPVASPRERWLAWLAEHDPDAHDQVVNAERYEAERRAREQAEKERRIIEAELEREVDEEALARDARRRERLAARLIAGAKKLVG